MTKRYIILAGLLSLLLMSSCETTEKIDDFPLRPKRLVVNCYFAEDSAWNFQVSHSLSVLDNADLKAVENASVLLFKGELFLDTIRMSEEDKWYRYEDNLPEQGETYSIEVSSPDFAAVLTAEDFVPLAVPVTDVSTVIRDSSFFDESYPWGSFKSGHAEGVFEITIKDPAQAENYYELSVYTHEINYDWEDSSIVYEYLREVWVTLEDENQDFFSSGNDLLFSDYLFDGQTYKVKLGFREWNVRPDQEFFVVLTSLNRTGYLYKKSIADYQSAKGDPFSEPVRIYCNIENGYGIFTGYSAHSFNFSLY